MDPVSERLLSILGGHVSTINARLILSRALREARLGTDEIGERALPKLIPLVERAAALFVAGESMGRLRAELKREIRDKARKVAACRLSVLSERDVSEARLLGRRMCEEMGARGFSLQKISTAVSELARNIISYTSGGSIELVPHVDPPPPRIVIRASDSGPGIANLEEVLSGRYRSKTGLGRGLAGTRRLVDRFDIKTGADGTRIEAEVQL